MSDNKSLKDIIDFRIDKLEKIKKSKVHSFAYSFNQNCEISNILENENLWMDK